MMITAVVNDCASVVVDYKCTECGASMNIELPIDQRIPDDTNCWLCGGRSVRIMEAE
jgi:DNA-directed RNA polymerase subunit RPC12/RpoP